MTEKFGRNRAFPTLVAPTMIARMILAAGIAFLVAAAGAAQETAPSSARRPVIALALEGGGALGLAHIGVIKVIEELGIPIDIVVGTSMGAIVGGGYAMGYDAATMESIVASADWADLFSEASSSRIESYRDRMDRGRFFASFGFDFHGFKLGSGLLTGGKVLSFLDRIAIAAPSPIDFDTLPRRYRAVAADVATGEKVVFDHGSVADAMRASMSIPGLFAPYHLDGRYFVDGGVVDNLPIRTAREMGADLVIAVDLRGGKKFSADAMERNPFEAVTRTMDIFIDVNVERQLPEADLVLPVDLEGYLTIDFADSAKILAAGEAAARAHYAELSAFADKVSAAGRTSPSVDDAVWAARTTHEPIQRLVVEGGTEAERSRTRELFAPLIGTEVSAQTLARPVELLHESGRYASVRIRRESVSERPTLVVSLEDKDTPGHAVRLGLSYTGTYAKSVSNRITLSPGVVFRGLVTEDSRVTVDADIIDALSVSTSILQPIARYFFVEGEFAYRREFDTYLGESSVGYQYQTIATTAGGRIGAMPFPGSELSVGWHYDWINESDLPGVTDEAKVDRAAAVEARFAVRRLDSPVFPMSGFSLAIDYLISSPAFASERSFRTLSTAGSGFLSLDTPFSVAFLWRAGTDFSASSDAWNTAPSYYKPDLADRRLFPGPLAVSERVGSHVAGVGIELKHRMFRAVGVPAFLLVHAATGVALQDPTDLNGAIEELHWNAALGAGLRLSSAFGISLRGGVYRQSSGDYGPFLAIDVGSMGY